jgi:DNA-directed RNA polymerase subunit E'/Rpb7
LDALNKKCVRTRWVRERELTCIRFSNKLVPGKGLALSVYDVLTAEDGKVTWGNGMMYYKGVFS